MSQFDSEEIEKDAVRLVAGLMAGSARTAPKGRGIDAVKTAIIDGKDLENLAETMDSRAAAQPPYLEAAFKRDAETLRKSGCVLLVGVTGMPKAIEKALNCGACGYPTCGELMKARGREGKDFYGPNCIFQVLDLGIALGSAVSTARTLNIDNRMMFTVGAAARKLKLLDADIIIGIPLSATGKSPYFDR